MRYTQEITLDVSCVAQYKFVDAKQGEKSSRFLKVTITEDGVKVTPGNGVSAYFRALKPDGNGIYNPATINNDGTISVELTQQTLAVEGNVLADVILVEGSAILAVASFTIQVGKAPLGNPNVESDTEFLALQDLVSRVEGAIVGLTGGYCALTYFTDPHDDGNLHCVQISPIDEEEF